MEYEKTLLSALTDYAESDYYPCHMPGHKRNPKVFSGEPRTDGSAQTGRGEAVLGAAARLDITEIEGFDNLHEPEGILKEAMDRAAQLYGADRTFYSVNGSTAGLLTAISAAVPEGGKLIMARNCHRAVYHAVYLRRLQPVYLYPEVVPGTELAGVLTAEQVEAALSAHPDAAAVLLTSPTYDGITARVGEIARVAHRYGVPLIVDGAHGAHFGFHPAFPDSPVHQGADLTVVSLHKTMPCMTQTALLHVRGDRVSGSRLRMFENMYQTSSPSYFLMAGMDRCIRLTEEKGAALWDSFVRDREDFLKGTKGLKALRIITAGRNDEAAGQMDPGKILIESSRAGLTGKQLYDILLKKYHLQMEMAAGNYVTAIMTCCDTKEGWERLETALCEIDGSCRVQEGMRDSGKVQPYPQLEAGCSLSEALDSPVRLAELSEAEGAVSGAFINLYPPGIPLAVPGERLNREVLELICSYRQQGLNVCGIRDSAVAVLESNPPLQAAGHQN